MPEMYQYDPELGYVPAIPEPFWERSWRTWMRWRPYCTECRLLLKNRLEWDTHYVLNHIKGDDDA